MPKSVIEILQRFINFKKFIFKILKEELMRQYLITENDRHPYYKRECFQVSYNI